MMGRLRGVVLRRSRRTRAGTISPTTRLRGVVAEDGGLRVRGLGSGPPTPCSMMSLRSYGGEVHRGGRVLLRSWTLLMPTEEPRFAGFTKTGYEIFSMIGQALGVGLPFAPEEVDVRGLRQPAAAKSCFMHLSIQWRSEEPEPTYAISASSKRPWMCRLRRRCRGGREDEVEDGRASRCAGRGLCLKGGVGAGG